MEKDKINLEEIALSSVKAWLGYTTHMALTEQLTPKDIYHWARNIPNNKNGEIGKIMGKVAFAGTVICGAYVVYNFFKK